jgi:hypothetical protein
MLNVDQGHCTTQKQKKTKLNLQYQSIIDVTSIGNPQGDTTDNAGKHLPDSDKLSITLSRPKNYILFIYGVCHVGKSR